MEQHPIPQQISSYEFKLVGDMTLKQFLKAAAGIVIALLIYSTKLVFFVKWPLMFIFGAGGLMLAFVPFEDRPLEQWIVAFIRSIYSPTIYTYRKTPDTNWLELKPKQAEVNEEKEETEAEIKLKDKNKVAEFIRSLPSVQREAKDEEAEKQVEESAEEVLEQIEEKTEEKMVPENKTEKIEEAVEEIGTANLNLKREKLEATGRAVFGEIPMPDKPEVPNMLVGMVTNNQGKIVEEAIVEVQDERGNPSRVLRTNSLGQFRTANPLASGKYLIIPEKEGYKFDRVEVTLSDQIVEPIKIKATL